MKELKINKGFEAMIPKSKENKQEKNLFHHYLQFNILGKEYKFILEVKRS